MWRGFDLPSIRQGARESERRLRDVVARIGDDRRAKFFALLPRAVRADQHAVAAGFADGFHDQFRRCVEHMVALRVVGEQEGRTFGRIGSSSR